MLVAHRVIDVPDHTLRSIREYRCLGSTHGIHAAVCYLKCHGRHHYTRILGWTVAYERVDLPFSERLPSLGVARGGLVLGSTTVDGEGAARFGNAVAAGHE